MTGSPTSAEADLLAWEREQSLKPPQPCDPSSHLSSDAAELTKAVAAALKKKDANHSCTSRSQESKPSRVATPDNDNNKISYRQLSKAQRRRLLWEVKLALSNQKKQRDDGNATHTAKFDNNIGTEEDEKTALGSLLASFTNDDTDYTTGYTTVDDDTNTEFESRQLAPFPSHRDDDEDDTSVDDTSFSLNTAELLQLESYLQSKNMNLKDVNEREYLETVGLGMCTLESGLVGCCPFLFCGGEAVENIAEEEEEATTVERDVGRVVDNSEVNGRDNVGGRVLEEITAEELSNTWMLCGKQDDVESAFDDVESTIDWNGGAAAGGGAATITSGPSRNSKQNVFSDVKSQERGTAVPMTVKQRLARKMGFVPTSRNINTNDDDENENESHCEEDGVEESNIKFCQADSEEDDDDDELVIADVVGEVVCEESSSCATSKSVLSATSKSVSSVPFKSVPSTPSKSVSSTPSKSVPSTPSESVSSTPSKSVPSTPSKSVSSTPSKYVPSTPSKSVSSTPSKSVPSIPSESVSSTPSKSVPSTPSKSVPSTPYKCVPSTPYKCVPSTPSKSVSSAPSESVPSTPSKSVPSVPSTPLKAMIVEEDPITPSTSSSVGIKKRFIPAFQLYEDDSAASIEITDNVQQDPEPQGVEEEGIERGIDDDFSPTPLAVNTQIPVVETKATGFSARHTFARAMMKLKKDNVKEMEDKTIIDEVVDEKVSSDPVEDWGDQPPSIPSTPLKAPIPATPLPKSNPSTPTSTTARSSTAVAAAAIVAATAGLTGLSMKQNACDDEKEKHDECETRSVSVDEEGFESSEVLVNAAENPNSSSAALKASIHSDPLCTDTQAAPLNGLIPPGVSAKQKFSRAIMKLKKKSNHEKPSSVELDFNGDADVVEIVTPIMTNRVSASRVSEEQTFTPDASDANSIPVPFTPSSQMQGQVINVSDLIQTTSSTSPLAKINKLARVMKRSKNKINQVEKGEEPEVDVAADEDGIESAVPVLPEKKEWGTEAEVSLPDRHLSMLAAEDECSADEASVTPTTPMLRLVKALSFHSQAGTVDTLQVDTAAEHEGDASAPSTEVSTEHEVELPTPEPVEKASETNSDVAVAIVMSDDSVTVENREERTQDATEPEESAPASKSPSEAFNPLPFGMMQMIGQALNFSPESKVDPTERASAEAASSNDGENAVRELRESPAAVDNTSPSDSDQDVSPDIKTSIDLTREMSIATQQINNKTAPSTVDLEPNDEEAPGSIEFTREMSVANRKASDKTRFKLTSIIQSKSNSMFSKVKSFTKGRPAANETKSQLSCSTATSISVSDHTDKMGNLSSDKRRKSKRWKEYTDPKTGMKYYSNGIATTWTKPSDFETSSKQVTEQSTIKDGSTNEEAHALNKSKIAKFLPTSSTPEGQSEPNNNDGSIEKPESRLAMLLKSKLKKDKTQIDEDSVCTGNITTDSDGNISVTPSPSKSEIVDRTAADDNAQAESEQIAETNPACTILASDSAKVVLSTLPQTTDTNSTAPTDNTEELKLKKKKMKRKKGWREYTCPNTGNKYYSNGKITQWEKPEEFNTGNVDEAIRPLDEAIRPQEENGSEKRVTIISFA